MQAKLIWIIASMGLIWLIQLSTVEATRWHATQLLPYFRRFKLDQTKNSVYKHNVKDALQKHLRAALVQKALCLPTGTKLSTDCLNRMVDKARQHENRFYARFTYACKKHAEYSAACLASGRQLYNRALQNLVKETESCWKA
ncbi:uncharacterized protein LOC128711124 [Anopheles marshallii]|uniref:uncharacterized protein LOC128711124 n=1 Tax=Anopheles marshallii TaxID=1521116 RepID=UPI00237AB9AC|nr:uncharacterized protein LOC128711124 [Anopheles marshallii]